MTAPPRSWRKAIRLVAVAFLALAAYVGGRAAFDLITGSAPDESVPGIILAIVSLIVMPVLAWRKRVVAKDLDGRALQADSTQTWICTYLSGFLLVGLLANSLLGWWWADPLSGVARARCAVAAHCKSSALLSRIGSGTCVPLSDPVASAPMSQQFHVFDCLRRHHLC